MFSSFSSISVPFGISRFLGNKSVPVISLKPVDIHEIETLQEKRARTLKHLIKLNHVNHAILFHNRQFHNHMPHVCEVHFNVAELNSILNAVAWVCVPTRSKFRPSQPMLRCRIKIACILGGFTWGNITSRLARISRRYPVTLSCQFHWVHKANEHQVRARVC